MYKKIKTAEDAIAVAREAEKEGLMGMYPQAAIILANAYSSDKALSFDDALNMTKGCFEYMGGYSDNEELSIYYHGIQTVINVLEAAKKRGLDDLQVAVINKIGKNK